MKIGVFVAGLLVVSIIGWRATAFESKQSTSPVKPEPQVRRIVSEGRLAAEPGANVVVGSDFAGILEYLPVKEKTKVQKGDVIARIRADDIRAALEEAQARVREADVDVTFYTAEVLRVGKLWHSGLGNEQDYDRAVRNRDAARARRQTAHATTKRIAATLAKSEIAAPIDGVVIARYVDPGEAVNVGSPLLAIVDLARTRVEAEVDEYDAGRIQLDDEVAVSADGYPGVTWRGRVSEIPDSVAERRLRPSDPALPFDSRVLVVKIELVEETPLVFGQRVNLEIGPRP